MIRRRRHDDTENTHRWLVSYADFITLLFAFFVVMYSISQVNEGKYRVLSDALLSAFEKTPASSQAVDAGSNTTSASGAGLLEGAVQPNPTEPATAEPETGERARAEQAEQEALSLPAINAPNPEQQRRFNQLYSELEQSLQPLIDAGLVALRGNQDWIEVDMRSGLLFESGSDVLGKSAEPVIRELADKLRDSRNLMRIRGYTDNQAIDTERFPSNWELSSARAVAVVRKLQSFGIPPARMAVEGFGEFNPIASNDTAEGRARNRRVVLAISRFHEQAAPATAADGKAAPAAGESLPAGVSPGQGISPAPGTVTGQNAPTQPEPDQAEQVDVVRLPNGGLLIRGRERTDDADNDAAKNRPAETPANPTP
ncbi:MAG: flagellar motor protein MotD [Permianibacter sp.]